MVELSAEKPFAGMHLPVQMGQTALAAAQAVPLFLIGTGQAGLPAPGRGDPALFWYADNAWISTQGPGVEVTDMWPGLDLTGADAGAVMARLCGLDVQAMQPGQVARVDLAHCPAIVLPLDNGFHIKLMRSFRESAVVMILAAMKSVAAQALLD